MKVFDFNDYRNLRRRRQNLKCALKHIAMENGIILSDGHVLSEEENRVIGMMNEAHMNVSKRNGLGRCSCGYATATAEHELRCVNFFDAVVLEYNRLKNNAGRAEK